MYSADELVAIHDAVTDKMNEYANSKLKPLAIQLGQLHGWHMVPGDWGRTVEQWTANVCHKLDPGHPYRWNDRDHAVMIDMLGYDPTDDAIEPEAPALRVVEEHRRAA